MPRLVLRFGGAPLKEVRVGKRAVTIGRAPDNDLPIDNPAVSGHHARVYPEAGHLVIEDLDSLNGTFVNSQRVKRITLRDGDAIGIGKHDIIVDERQDAPFEQGSVEKLRTPKVQETMVLDTKERRDLLQQVLALGERAQMGRVRVASLAVFAGKAEQKEYLLSSKLTVIGKSKMATVRLLGWFAPQVAAQINRHEDGYYIGRGSRIPKVNGELISAPTKLGDGDVIEVGGVSLRFFYRD